MVGMSLILLKITLDGGVVPWDKEPMSDTLNETDAECLRGDAPGATAITIEVDGRKLRVSRMLLSSVVCFASNRASDLFTKTDDGRSKEWLVDFEKQCWQLSDFVESRH